MLASALVTRPRAAAGRNRPTATMAESMPHRSSPRRSHPRTAAPTSSPVAARGILDSYRSAQQQAPPPRPPSPSASEQPTDFDDEGGEACPVGCVAEISRKSELERALAAAEARGGGSASPSSPSPPAPSPSGPCSSSSAYPLPRGIVVVDFYKTACGACKYIAPGFVKLCKSAQRGGGESDEIPDIVFLKHNVERDGDGSSDDDSDGDGGGGGGGGRTALAVALKIRSVPLFHVYRGRELVASFATRDRKRVADAINEAVGREVL